MRWHSMNIEVYSYLSVYTICASKLTVYCVVIYSMCTINMCSKS